MHDAVGHEVIGLDAEHAQAAKRNDACGCAVAVVVGNNRDVLAFFASPCKAFRCFSGAFKCRRRNHAAPGLLKVCR